MEPLSSPPLSRDLRALLGPLLELAELCPEVIVSMAGSFVRDGRTYGIPRILFLGPPAAHDPIRIGIFGGLHGDEPAGVHALVALVETLIAEPSAAAGYELVIYPVINPTGYEDGTRHNRDGVDLNREFWRGSAHPEVRLMERELRGNAFAGLITLHADDTSDGIYGYAHGRVLNEALLQPALHAAERVLPRNRTAVIDGFSAREGLLAQCYVGVLSAAPGVSPRPFDLIFETPALAPLDLQVEAAVTALLTVLDEYRVFLAHAINL